MLFASVFDLSQFSAILGYLEYPDWLHPEVIPGLKIPRWYSLMYVLAFTITYFLMRHQYSAEKDLDIPPEKKALPYPEEYIQSYFLWCILAMLFFIRFVYVIFYEVDRAYYLTRPWLIWWPFRGGEFVGLQGLSYHGGVLGLIVGMWLFSRRYRQPFLIWADALTASVPLGYTFGRLGNFFNGELYGRVTTMSWGMVFPQAEQLRDTVPTRLGWVQDMAAKVGMEIQGATINLPRHPSQFYEAFGEGILLWLILWFIIRPRRPYPGFVSGCYLIGYGLIRFLLEYLRQPDSYPGYVIQLSESSDVRYFSSFGNISMGQVLSFGMILGGLLVIGLSRWLYNYRLLKTQLEARDQGGAQHKAKP
ncbi:prolipoprotein diacylglyceryl transferase [Candidatus Haliotispira prima]|uniref:Phosphatidylglycerol--prolipoprotein diacylglyceryl transferase n=1 Tax=Candidatus Haliotispira prima TaxID=3034016 RepID=A0ABY8MLD9_9SPIO|nr:prolipoprotein diacylglyceryl transferase [Candidatus Haliotispira prima]